MQQEELARLFSANMTLQQAAPQPEQIQPAQQQQQQQEQEQTSTPIVYASTHYTHSYHVIPTHPTPTPAEKTHLELSDTEAILLRNSIDPSLLFPSQVDLFQNADDDQRLRLLELWRISPPQGRQGIPGGTDYNMSRQLYDWPPTSLAQEEAMAKLRYERAQEEQAQTEAIQRHQQELDQSMDSAAVSAARGILASSPDSAEPYIVSGYEMMARREYEASARSSENNLLRESSKYNQATDPVYNTGAGNHGLWEKNVGSILDMENQYGAFAYARDYDARPHYGDEEMVM